MPPHIVVFDSGLGGLSIFQALQALNQYRLSYLADHAFFPYGTQDQSDLRQRIVALLKAFAAAHQPDMIIIACNTASTQALDDLRQALPNIDIVGVVPAIKPAAKLSNTKHIALLATPSTVASAYTKSLIKEFAPYANVEQFACPELVSIAEDKIKGRPVDREHLKALLTPIFANELIDTAVLACTHFPLIAEELSAVIAPRALFWVDSTQAIVRRVQTLLPIVAAEQFEQESFAFSTQPWQSDVAQSIQTGFNFKGCNFFDFDMPSVKAITQNN